MSTAIITLSDDGNGAVDVTLDFGKKGTDDDSRAHHMAIAMLRSQTDKPSVEVKEIKNG